MTSIEEIISGNKETFNDKEPSAGHFKRFKIRLEKNSGVKSTKSSIVPYLLRAAVITLLVAISSLWTWEHFIDPDRKRMELGDVSPQYKEVENYYIHQVSIVENQIERLDLRYDPGQKRMLRNEINSMDSIYVSLQRELKANPDDERIINAMIEHYQTKLEMVNYILSVLKTVKDNNQNSIENEKFIL